MRAEVQGGGPGRDGQRSDAALALTMPGPFTVCRTCRTLPSQLRQVALKSVGRSELRVIGLATEVALRVQRDELSRLPPLDVQVTRGAHLHVMASRSFHRWSTAERPFLYREDRHCQQSEPAKDSDVTEP